MKNLPIISMLLLYFSTGVYNDEGSLITMVTECTGQSYKTTYSDYGCCCKHPRNGQPVDATDKCCNQHSCCYSGVHNTSRGCTPKTVAYQFTISNGSIFCDDDLGSCRRNACECDRTLTLCLNDSRSTYNESYLDYHKKNCKGPIVHC